MSKRLLSLVALLLWACDSETSVGEPATGLPGTEVGKPGPTGPETEGPSASEVQRDGEASSEEPVPSTTSGRKRIFVTNNQYSGNLKALGGGSDGLDGADKLCALAATSMDLGGQWRAWLSTSKVHAIDRIAEVGPWYNMNGLRVFNNKANILTGVLTPIAYDERGDSHTGASDEVWTGTGTNGRRAVFTEQGEEIDGSCATPSTPVLPSSGPVHTLGRHEFVDRYVWPSDLR